MPQVANLLKLSSQSAAPSSRKAFLSEPNQKFEDVLKNQSSQKDKRLDKIDHKQTSARTGKNAEKADESDDAEKAEHSNADKKEAASKTKSSKQVNKKDDQPVDDVESTNSSEKKNTEVKNDAEDQHTDADAEADDVELTEPGDSKQNDEESRIECDTVDLSAQVQAAMNQPAVDQTASTETSSDDKAAVESVTTNARVATEPKTAKAGIKTEPKIETDAKPEAAPLELSKEAAKQDHEEEADDSDDALNLVDLHAKAAKSLDRDDSHAATKDLAGDLLQVVDASATKTQNTSQAHQPTHVQQAVAPERHFSENNVERIVTNISGNLSSNGGTMKIRLDPPNLGELHVNVTVDQDGTLSASFQTSNAEATRLLSHNIQNLKSSLEATGVNVDKIQVKQAAPSEQSSSQNGSNDQDRHQQHAQDHPARQEQQRREILEKMWRKMVFGEEPLDLVA